MSEYNAPRRGSKSYYPRVRAAKETPSLKGYGAENKPLNFLCYKVGMTQAMGKNVHKASPSFNQEVVVATTVVECPPMKVFAVRAYVKAEIGFNVLSDVIAENHDSKLERKINNFKHKTTKKERKENTDAYTIADFEKELNDIEYFTLLVNTQPSFKKTPEVTEVYIGGTKEEQLNYCKEKLGKEITINDVFNEGEFLDVRAVTRGKGFQGPVKRFHVRSLRPKNKRERVVGSIGPWHPHTVMFSVARPGQMGYQCRTETNKKVILISEKVEEVNPSNGFCGYGNVKGKFALIYGSLPGPAKRCVALRKGTRPELKSGLHIDSVTSIVRK